MIGKVISIHSSRGGAGKSVIAVNLAMTFLKKGYNVALLDLDFRAPSLFYVFKEAIKGPIKYWLNDFFNDRCKIDKVLLDLSERCGTHAKILIGLANPSIYAIRDMMGKSQLWEVSALKKLYLLRSNLMNEMDINYVIYDTSPGIQYSSINAITSSDLPIVVATSDPLDIEGVTNMLSEFYEVFEKKTVILVNKAFPDTDLPYEKGQKELLSQLEETWGHSIIGMIPCYCDILRARRDYLLAFQNPNHPFLVKLNEIAEKLMED